MLDWLLRGGSDAAEGRVQSVAMPGLFRIFSSSGGVVFVDRHDGKLVHLPEDPVGRGPGIVAFVPPQDPGCVFLCPDVDVSITLEHDTHRASLLSYRIEDLGDGNRLLRHPITSLLLSAAPFKPGPIHVLCNRVHHGEWEIFRLASLPAAEAPQALTPLRAVERLYRAGLTPDAIVAWLGDEDPIVLNACAIAVVRLLAPAVLHDLSQRLAADRVLLDRLASACGDDFWLGSTLRRLGAWLDGRPSIGRLSLDHSCDFLGRDDGLSGARSNPGAQLVTLIRSQIPARQTLAIVAAVGRDGLYLLEWIAHHRALGVEHFFLYSNQPADASDALLAALADNGIVTWVDERHQAATDRFRKTCGHALSCLPQTLDYRWTLVIDVDEFVVLDRNRHSSLPDLLSARQAGGADAVVLSRLLFRPGPETVRRPRPVTRRFQRRQPPGIRTVKTIFVTAQFVSCYPHDPVSVTGAQPQFHDASGGRHHWPGKRGRRSEAEPRFEDAWINIYMSKSIEEVLWSKTAMSPRELVGHVRSLDEEGLLKDDRASAHLPDVAIELDRLRTLPGVADAELLVCRTFRDGIESRKAELSACMRADPILRGVAATWLMPSSDASVVDVSPGAG